MGRGIHSFSLRLGLTALVSMVLAGTVVADVPWHSLFPRPRPALLNTVPATDGAVAQALGFGRQIGEAPAAPSVASGLARSLLPRPRPPAAAARFAAAQERAASSRRRARTGTPVATADPRIRRGICGVRAIEGRQLPRITSSTRGCGVAQPVSVTSVHGIPLSRAARLDCDMARAFAEWVDDSLVPAVGRRGGGVAEIRVIGDYSCRTRNSVRGARISEHGRGMAIDVAGYQLVNGDVVTVLNDFRRRPHRSDLQDMYEEACGIFRTTLSPDADRHHQDHFHFDLAQHRGGGSYCR